LAVDIAATDDIDPREAIVRLEARIEALEAKIESCQKFILAARVAIGLGLVILAALVFGLVRFDPTAMLGSIAAVLCGIIVAGSNGSTAKEAETQLTVAEAERAVLIGAIELRVVGDEASIAPRTLH
jgi:hypothetical protein